MVPTLTHLCAMGHNLFCEAVQALTEISFPFPPLFLSPPLCLPLPTSSSSHFLPATNLRLLSILMRLPSSTRLHRRRCVPTRARSHTLSKAEQHAESSSISGRSDLGSRCAVLAWESNHTVQSFVLGSTMNQMQRMSQYSPLFLVEWFADTGYDEHCLFVAIAMPPAAGTGKAMPVRMEGAFAFVQQRLEQSRTDVKNFWEGGIDHVWREVWCGAGGFCEGGVGGGGGGGCRLF